MYELFGKVKQEYETIHIIERKNKKICIFLEKGFDLTEENIVDVAVHELKTKVDTSVVLDYTRDGSVEKKGTRWAKLETIDKGSAFVSEKGEDFGECIF